VFSQQTGKKRTKETNRLKPDSPGLEMSVRTIIIIIIIIIITEFI